MSAMDYRLEDGTPAFRNLLQMLERVASGFSFTEGPVWRGDDLLFSDIPNSRTVVTGSWQRDLRSLPSVTRPTDSNGLTLDLEGNLLACEHTSRSVTRVDARGQVTTLAASYDGKRLNSPNDIVVRSDGTIFFTDPPYGLRRLTEGRELPFAASIGSTATVVCILSLTISSCPMDSPSHQTRRSCISTTVRTSTFGHLTFRLTDLLATASCFPSSNRAVPTSAVWSTE